MIYGKRFNITCNSQYKPTTHKAMKTRNYFSALMILLALSLGIPSTASAQHHHHRPHWVDVHCCDAATRYVFFPEHNFYYDLVREVYIYPSGGVWISSFAVPAMYASIDLAFVPIIELDIHIDSPFMFNHDHLAWYRHHHHDHHYVRYYRGHGHEGHYAHYKRHHDRHDYYDNDRHDHGNHYGHYKGNKGGHGKGHGHGKGNYKNYDKKGNGSYANRDYEHRGNGSGNDRKGNGGRSSNGRGR